jgi:hypothetical protein
MLKIKQIAAIFSVMSLTLSTLSADTIKPNGCKGADLCNSFPIYDGCGWNLQVGILVEQMRVSNSTIAVRNTVGNGTVNSPTDINSLLNINFDVSVGLRLGVGKYFVHDDWMINTKFEWMSSKGTQNQDLTASNGSIVPTGVAEWWGLALAPSDYAFQNLEASLKVDYFLLDVYLSRGSYFSGTFNYEPFAGIEAAWLGYNMSQSYYGVPSTASSAARAELTSTESAIRKVATDFWGVGPVVGVNSNYHLVSGWSFFSATNFAVLLGEVSISDRQGVVTTENLPSNSIVSGTLQVLSPAIRNIIGLQYDKDIFCDKQHCTLRFGFDSRYYFNQYPVVNLFANADRVSTGSQINSVPTLVDNNSWGMVGFILDFGWDF